MNAPSPLIDRLSALRERTRTYAAAKEVARDDQRYRSVLDEVAPPTQTLGALADLRAMLSEAGVPVPEPEPPGTETGQRARALREAFDASPEAVVEEGQTAARRDLVRRIKAIGGGWTSQLQAAWRAYVVEVTPDLSAEVLAVLRQREDYAAAVGRIEADLEKLGGWAAALPQDEGEVARVAVAAARVREEWDRLVGGSIDAEVLSLLRAAGGGGAPLDLLTGPVRGWLETHGLASAFVVTMRSAPTREG